MITHAIYRKPSSNDFGISCVTTEGFVLFYDNEGANNATN